MNIRNLGQHSGAVNSTVTSQEKVSGFESAGRLGPCCMAFACSSCVGFLQQDLEEKAYRLDQLATKLSLGVNVSVSGCWSLCLPYDGLATCPGWTVSFTGSQLELSPTSL